MYYRVSLLILILLFTRNSAQTTIQDVVDLITVNKVTETITSLVNFGTRFQLAPNRFEVANWLKAQFENMGFTNVELDSFQCGTVIHYPPFLTNVDTTITQVNVIATLPGTEKPEEIYIICGHYDCSAGDGNMFLNAPGADDNASGTAAVLESARAVMESGYQPKATLKFIAFGAEELLNFGDGGSEHYAAEAADRGDDIQFVINNDMIAYSIPNAQFETVNIGNNNYSGMNEVINFASAYSGLFVETNDYTSGDLRAFLNNGYDGIYFEENVWNEEHYHSIADVIENIFPDYCTKVIKASCAVMLGMESTLTSKEDIIIPKDYFLSDNYPNPFNPSTRINYKIPNAGNVKLKIYNTLGEEIAEIVNEYKPAGSYMVEFNPDYYGGIKASGVYIYTLYVNGLRESKKMTLLK